MDVLKLNNIELNDNEFFVINAYIDGSIREAVTAFALVQAALRERFVTALTHDLRNPLSNALAYAEMINRSADFAKIKEFGQEIIENLNRRDSMIQDLLDSAKFQTGERLPLRFEEFDIQEVVEEVYGQLTVTHGPRFQFTGNIAKGWWDREAIKRAIENIVGNAVKYGRPGTPVRIKIDSLHERMLLSVLMKENLFPPKKLKAYFSYSREQPLQKMGTRIVGV